MADLDNDRDRAVERPRETVIVQDRKRSTWSWLLPLLLALAVLVGLYILFSPEKEDATINTPDQVQIDTPNVTPPDVDVDVNRVEDGNTTAQ